MIEVRVGHKNGVDRGQIIDVQSGTLEPFDHAQPHRPVGIDEHIHPFELNQERGMPNPGNADFARAHFGKERIGPMPGALREERRRREMSPSTRAPINPLRGFRVDPARIARVGRDLQRPECILAEPDGTLWSADARGGVMRIAADGRQQLVSHQQLATSALSLAHTGE